MTTATAPTIDTATRRWIRNASDERAARNGCRFDEASGQFVVDWIEKYCRLYEGEWAGQPLMLRGCLKCGDSEEARKHYPECVAAKHNVHWQYDCTMRIFGWLRWSEKWQREIRRFRQASIFVPKKNCKSPSLAAWGIYLLAGDGEPGQKVFLAAKDGTQAREIAGKHAIEMLAKSADLSDDCDVNKTLMRITHTPSRSILQPLSSSNERTQKTKEGLNGSVLVDEVHVVDRDFMAIISRAGISRSEPLQIEVSTAGNNPDGYGKQRFDYATEVVAGTREDQELFVAIHAAPQDLTDADLDADPLKWGRMANPAMGHTVDPEEYLTDYTRSKSSLRTLLDFKMYRLNIWQKSANPWLKLGDWQACRVKGEDTELDGLPCGAGLDLSKTQDMSSLVLVFPMPDDAFRLLPFFWLPEQVARENDHLAPFMTWARDGFLILTPGNVIDYGYIRGTFRKLAKRFNIQKLAYDKTYAEETTQALEQGVVSDTGALIEEGTGVERIVFPQTLMTFTAPCKDFERLIISGKLQHHGHPIMDWQAGHVQVWRDANNNIRPIKPKTNDVRKIDGIVAAIMGYWAATQIQVFTPGVEVW